MSIVQYTIRLDFFIRKGFVIITCRVSFYYNSANELGNWAHGDHDVQRRTKLRGRERMLESKREVKRQTKRIEVGDK